jgi:hypothetical protein
VVDLHRTALWLPPDPRDGGADRRVLVLSKRSLSSSPESSRTVTTATLLSASFEGAADALTISALAPAAADAALPREDAVFPDAAAAADLDSTPLAPPAEQNFTWHVLPEPLSLARGGVAVAEVRVNQRQAAQEEDVGDSAVTC